MLGYENLWGVLLHCFILWKTCCFLALLKPAHLFFFLFFFFGGVGGGALSDLSFVSVSSAQSYWGGGWGPIEGVLVRL